MTNSISVILVSAALALASNLTAALPIANNPPLAKPITKPVTKKVVRKIVRREIARQAPILRSLVGPEGPAGSAGPAGTVGPVGSKGSPAIELYAHVLANGTVVPEDSFGITQANVFRTGNRYCVTGLPSYVNVGQVTVDFFQIFPTSSVSSFIPTFGHRAEPGCEIFVQMSSGTAGFYLMLY